jgi:hypothetical protein
MLRSLWSLISRRKSRPRLFAPQGPEGVGSELAIARALWDLARQLLTH